MDLSAESAEPQERRKKKNNTGVASEEADKPSTFSILLDLVDC